MKQKKKNFNLYGLRARFALSLGSSALLCALLFLVLYHASDYYLTNYFEQSDSMESRIQRQGKSLQEYVHENRISSKDLHRLKKWESRQPLILLEIYSEGKCIYSSFYDSPEDDLMNSINAGNADHRVSVQLTDGKVLAFLYSDFSYQYYVMGTAVSAALALTLFIILFLRGNRKLIHYICRLNNEIQILEGGNLEYQISVEGNDEITDLAKSMNRMRESFQYQMETEQALYQANRRLITEMSHDLRTPLTGMMLYLEILRSHRYTSEEELQKYLEKIDAKAHHIKQLSDHLFEYSLADAPVKKIIPQSAQEAFNKVIVSFQDDLSAHGFPVTAEIVWAPCYVDINNEFIRRIFDNIISNAVKYAEPTAEIIVNTIDTNRFFGFSVMNTCSASDHQMESTGIGIESIHTMMRQMNGYCTVEHTETAFEISLLFPKQ